MSGWSPFTYYSAYDDFVAKATELHYVDAVLDLLEQDWGGASPGQAGYDYTLGTFHPFEKTVYLKYGADARLNTAIEQAATDAESWRDRTFSGSDTEVQFIVRPSARALETEVNRLRDGATAIGLVANDNDIGGLRAYLSDWRGQAHESFMVFHAGVGTAAANQRDFVNAVANYLDIAGGAIHAGQVDLQSSIVALEGAADDQLRKRAQDSRGPSTAEILSVLAAVGAAGSAIPGPQQAFVVGATLVLSISSVAAGSAETEEETIEAASAESLGSAFTSRWTDIRTGVNSVLSSLDTQVSSLKELFDGEFDANRLYPREVGIDASTGADDFYRAG